MIRALLFCAAWLCRFLIILFVAVVIFFLTQTLMWLFSEPITTLEQIDSIVAEERLALQIPEKVKIEIYNDENAAMFLAKYSADGATVFRGKNHFTFFLKRPTVRLIIRHELMHVHVSTTLDYYNYGSTKQAIVHEFLAYLYGVTSLKLI